MTRKTCIVHMQAPRYNKKNVFFCTDDEMKSVPRWFQDLAKATPRQLTEGDSSLRLSSGQLVEVFHTTFHTSCRVNARFDGQSPMLRVNVCHIYLFNSISGLLVLLRPALFISGSGIFIGPVNVMCLPVTDDHLDASTC